MASTQAHIRRLEDTLIISGDGVIAFSVWSVIKTVMFLLEEDRQALLDILGIDGGLSVTLMYAVVGLMLGADLLVRVYVGFSARAEGLRGKRGRLYLVVALLAAISNASSAATIIFSIDAMLTPLDMLVSASIDVTSVAALLLVFTCALSLRRLCPESR